VVSSVKSHHVTHYEHMKTLTDAVLGPGERPSGTGSATDTRTALGKSASGRRRYDGVSRE
jgi:hypothetical protein